MSEGIHVLHVDDDPDTVELVSAFLERQHDDIDVMSRTDPRNALEDLENGCVDCVVSDYDMPRIDGLELLDEVRNDYPDIPFILFTGKGSEEVASEAISKGVTDYIQKESGTEKYEVLANRVRNAVEKRRAEEALRESREEMMRLATAIEASMDGIAILDEDEEYVYVNEAHARIYGYDVDELVGETWKCLYDGDELQRFEDEVMPTLRNEGEWRGEAVGTRKDGTEFPQELSLSTTNGNIICVVRDVTERKERENELEESRERYYTLVEEANYGVVILQDGEVRSVNPEMAEMLDANEDEVVGTPVEEFVSSEDAVDIRKYESGTGDDEGGYEIELVSPSGESVSVEITASGITYEGSSAVMAVVREI